MSRLPRIAAPLLLTLLLTFALGAPARGASPAPLGDIGEKMLLAHGEAGPGHFRAAPLEGSNFWFDFVSTRAGRLLRLFSDDLGDDAVDVGRFASVFTVGYQYARDMFTLEATIAALDAGQVRFPAGGAVINGASTFANPSLVFSIRPVEMFRIDVDASYTWAFGIGDSDTEHMVLTGGLHFVFEPTAEFFGVEPRWEIAVGAQYARATIDVDPALDATALLLGGRATAIVPLGREIAVTFGFGAYAGFDPADFGAFDPDEPNRHLNLEWQAGLRWFPLGG